MLLLQMSDSGISKKESNWFQTDWYLMPVMIGDIHDYKNQDSNRKG